jgi:hypothetical protein
LLLYSFPILLIFPTDSVSNSVAALYSYARQCLDQSELILKKEIEDAREKRLGPSLSSSAAFTTSISSPSMSTSPSPTATPTTTKKAQQPDTAPTNLSTTRLSGSGPGTGINAGGEEVTIGGGKPIDEEPDGRKQIQAAMHEAQQKNLILLQSYPFII